jgi:hypothetical protein
MCTRVEVVDNDEVVSIGDSPGRKLHGHCAGSVRKHVIPTALRAPTRTDV